MLGVACGPHSGNGGLGVREEDGGEEHRGVGRRKEKSWNVLYTVHLKLVNNDFI